MANNKAIFRIYIREHKPFSTKSDFWGLLAIYSTLSHCSMAWKLRPSPHLTHDTYSFNTYPIEKGKYKWKSFITNIIKCKMAYFINNFVLIIHKKRCVYIAFPPKKEVAHVILLKLIEKVV